MTREEAIEILLDMANDLQIFPESKQGQAYKMAIKALEQEPIFDKIRDEIKELSSYVARFNGGAFAIHIDKEKVLQIIDKYRGESDCRECKAEHDCYECKKYTESEE